MYLNAPFDLCYYCALWLYEQIGELAKSFLWDPFFPVHLDATLFHVLLLFSKHCVQFVPVTEQSIPKVIGFVTKVDYFLYILEWHYYGLG